MESRLSRSQALQRRRDDFVLYGACGQISAGETLDPLLDLQGGEAEIDVVHAGPPLVLPDQGADIRAEDRCDGARERHAEEAPCEAGASFNEFIILHCNIRGFLSHRAELEGQIRLLTTGPAMICLNETFLDEGVRDDQVWLGGYTLASRRDRQDGRGGGGILCFVADRFAQHIVFREHSEVHERSWHIIHSDIGPILCGVWYRPPCSGEIDSIRGCEEEFRKLSEDTIATILVGDMNVHHRRWLRHSSGITMEGKSLFQFCLRSGLKQLVKKPTRGDNLLDLVISDLDGRITVLPQIADHNMVSASFAMGITEGLAVRRSVFEYSKADWDKIGEEIWSFDWSPMESFSVDESERYLHESLFGIITRHIPRRDILERKSAHPWINDRCLDAIKHKNLAAGTIRFAAECSSCSRVLFEEFLEHVKRMRDKLLREKRGSKQWWRTSNQIMDKSAARMSVPSLQIASGWVHDSAEKAKVFADTFASKFVLPATESNVFSREWPCHTERSFVLVRSRRVAKCLEQLDMDSGTGPDELSAMVLKMCARQLSLPLSKLIRSILEHGFWPSAWIIHWLVPLHKRKSKSEAGNYRAINLTTQISKVVERYLSQFFVPTLELRAFGSSQFAYRKLHGARDAVLYYVLSWIEALNVGRKVGVYCSDVQGAFDRVDAQLLLRKLCSFGLNEQLLKVIQSWLWDRIGYVIVGGKKSNPIILRNMVYAGTVWGPSLWNSFFGDCVCAIKCCGFEVVIYADDCNAFKSYARNCSTQCIIDDLHECQQSLHRWGRANAVTFDAGKEETMIVATIDSCDGPIKLLGIDFDNKLAMHKAVHKCAIQASLKSRSLLRCRRFYNTADMIMLYKSHILSYIEYRTAGIHFACTSVLAEVDDVQSRFITQLELSEEAAFMHFNLAPLSVRRDISILGVIHRAALRKGPPELWKFFRREVSHSYRRSVRFSHRHSRCLIEWAAGSNLEIMRRSALGMIRVYNLLPEELVDKVDLKEFQRGLTQLVRDRVTAGDHRWRFLLSPRHALFQFHPLIS